MKARSNIKNILLVMAHLCISLYVIFAEMTCPNDMYTWKRRKIYPRTEKNGGGGVDITKKMLIFPNLFDKEVLII